MIERINKPTKSSTPVLGFSVLFFSINDIMIIIRRML